jgi:hypothetical protein
MTVHTPPPTSTSGATPARLWSSTSRSSAAGELMIATYADIHMAEDPSKNDQIAFGRVTSPNGFDIIGVRRPAVQRFRPRREHLLHHPSR